MSALTAVILGAGLGTRMKSREPKVLHTVLGVPMIVQAVRTAEAAGADRVVVVLGHGRERVEATLKTALPESPIVVAVQAEQRGTGHAVLCAKPLLPSDAAQVLVMYGDVPSLRAETVSDLVRSARASGASLSCLSACFEDPSGYGRIVRGPRGKALRVVEHTDATESERAIGEINAGIYVFDGGFLRQAIEHLSADNAQAEFYLTDLVAAAAGAAGADVVVVADADEVLGVNTRVDLARAERIARDRVNDGWMRAGVTLIDPLRTYIDRSVVLNNDVVIFPGVTLRGSTVVEPEVVIETGAIVLDSHIESGSIVRAYSHIDGAHIGRGCRVGPYGRLRPGTVLETNVQVGNFVEVKKSRLGQGTKANHLAYLGDATVGDDVNVGAGTITCNYDGIHKHSTVIGEGAFIGSNTELVAPVTVGARAYVGAGSTVTDDVPADALTIGRARQRNIEDYAKRKRDETD